MPESPLLYFAYGSNMATARLQARIPSAQPLHKARLAGYSLSFHKRGRDRSGKCGIVATERARDLVYGVVFEVSRTEQSTLAHCDAFGYEEHVVSVHYGHALKRVFTYVACHSHLDPSLRPFRWYKAFVIQGAREHALPPSYIQRLDRVPAIPDPIAARARRHHQILKRR